jgi:hypothetical protein
MILRGDSGLGPTSFLSFTLDRETVLRDHEGHVAFRDFTTDTAALLDVLHFTVIAVLTGVQTPR